MFDLVFYTYSGMPIPLGEGLTKEEARHKVKSRIARARREGQPVSKIGKGEWEFETPESSALIGDDDGTLVLRRSHKKREYERL